jgi:predicted NAD/FAD-binding protein
MLSDILRFNRESTAWLLTHPDNQRSLRDFLSEGRYSAPPSPTGTCCRWPPPSGPARPARCSTCRSPPSSASARTTACCKSSTGPCGARSKAAVANTSADRRHIAANDSHCRLACPVSAVTREGRGLRVTHAAGSEHFDQVVMACHSDQSLAILGFTASDAQRDVLSAIRYQPNRAILHTDPALLPRDRKCGRRGITLPAGQPGEQPVGVSYLINKLQPLPFETPVVVTLNPAREPDPAKVHGRIRLRPPDLRRSGHRRPATPAPPVQGDIQGGGIWLAGAWGSYGFHEDGLKSALRVATAWASRPPGRASASQSAAALA